MNAAPTPWATAAADRGHTGTVRPPRLRVANQPLAEQLGEVDVKLVDMAMTAPDVVRREAARLRRLADAGATRPPDPATVVYRLTGADGEQTGVIVDVSVDAYREGRIRPHEDIRPERDRQLAAFLEAARLELVPVTLFHPSRRGLSALLADVTAGEPHVRVRSPDDLQQTVWIEPSAQLAEEIHAELAGVEALYIADGHHRMAAAARYAAQDTEPAARHVLGALFPAGEMRVLGYHRAIARPAGASTSDLVSALADQPGCERLDEGPGQVVPIPGTVAVRLDGRWFRLRLRASRMPAAQLDVEVLENSVLASLLQVADPHTDARMTPLAGTFDAETLARWCAERESIGFLLHPPTVDEIIAVADTGHVLPPKSTWFAPKARAGPFLRDLT